MKVIRKKPGQAPEACEVENSLEALQAEVGGYIESFQFADDCTLLINEEGKNLGLTPNLFVLGEPLVGTVLAVGVKGEEFCDLTANTAHVLMRMLGKETLWLS